jgi:hypothetical protein
MLQTQVESPIMSDQLVESEQLMSRKCLMMQSKEGLLPCYHFANFSHDMVQAVSLETGLEVFLPAGFKFALVNRCAVAAWGKLQYW